MNIIKISKHDSPLAKGEIRGLVFYHNKVTLFTSIPLTPFSKGDLRQDGNQHLIYTF